MPNRADLNSEAICKARHRVVFTKTDSHVASGSIAPESFPAQRTSINLLCDHICRHATVRFGRR